MPDIDVELITTREASRLLNESVRQTIRRVERGELAPVKKLDGLRGSYIFDRATVQSLAPSTPVESTSPNPGSTAPHAAAETSPEAVSAAAFSRSGDAA